MKPPRSAGHRIAQALLAKHGRDRFPTITANLLQLGSETGELLGAWAKALGDLEVPQAQRYEAARRDPAVLKELGDVALTLYILASKLGVDLLDVMSDVVAAEERTFA